MTTALIKTCYSRNSAHALIETMVTTMNIWPLYFLLDFPLFYFTFSVNCFSKRQTKGSRIRVRSPVWSSCCQATLCDCVTDSVTLDTLTAWHNLVFIQTASRMLECDWWKSNHSKATTTINTFEAGLFKTRVPSTVWKYHMSDSSKFLTFLPEAREVLSRWTVHANMKATKNAAMSRGLPLAPATGEKRTGSRWFLSVYITAY